MNLSRIIWGFSEANTTSDESSESLTFIPEGTMRTYLTDPKISTPVEQLAHNSWRLSRRMTIPARHTSYWCTIHKGPELLQKHHIVGYSPYFGNSISERHVHHQVAYRCTPPPGMDPTKFYSEFVNHPGAECYLENEHQFPATFCTEVVATWSFGGHNLTLPLDYGLAIGEQQNEYFMLETHYDNQETRNDLEIDTRINFYYSPQIRPNEGSVIVIGVLQFGLFRAPPQQQNFTIMGQCSPKCTEQMLLPTGGVEIRVAALHSHLTGRKMRLRHFRGNTELPWILSDQTYDFSFQQKRLLSRPAQVLPGDHLVGECVLDTTSRNTTTLTAFATTDEMCSMFLFLDKRIPYTFCTSYYPVDKTMDFYGIRNMTWSREEQERVVNAADNPDFVGRSFGDVVDAVANGTWTENDVRNLESEQNFEEHDTSCYPLRLMNLAAHEVLMVDDVTGGLIPGREILDRIKADNDSYDTAGTDACEVSGRGGGL